MNVMRTLKFAFRTLVRTPFVTSVAIVSLALGIGANSGIFSLFDQMLLRPLPVRAPGQLVNLSAPGPKPGSQSCNQAGDCDDVFSYSMFLDLEREQDVFTGIAAHREFGANLAYRGRTLSGSGMLVSGSYFPVLGLAPTLGRLLDWNDDHYAGESLVTVLSFDYWHTHFGDDRGVLNQTIIVNGQTLTIVGVGPRGFDGTTLGSKPNIFVPITLHGLMQPGFDGFWNRRNYWAYLFARLKPGVTIEQARTGLNVPYRAIVNTVEAPLQKGMSDATLQRFRAKQVTLAPGAQGQSSLHGDSHDPLILLMCVTGLVLLIACANIANLLLARSAARAGEMAVRLSIGASRGQLIRQLLAESCLLSIIGGACGLVVARATLMGIIRLLPNESAELIDLHLEPAVLLFTMALSIGAGLLFGVFPAFHSTRPDLAATLKGTAGQPSGARGAKWFGDDADCTVDGAARQRRAVHQEPRQRQPRRSRREDRSRRHVRRLAGAERLHERTVAGVVRRH
jgi:predicted permease